MKKNKLTLILTSLLVLLLTASACGNFNKNVFTHAKAKQNIQSTESTKHVMIAAAASLETVMEKELIPAFKREYSDVTVEGNYDSSGKLQTQIEKGLAADIFFSAATKQMDALVSQHLIAKDQVVPLLENQLVFIVPKNSTKDWRTFNDLSRAELVAVGDPTSVPAGQYAEKGLKALGIWEDIKDHASFGTNVTEVLNWVASGSAAAGLVYATDAAASPHVKVVATLPATTLNEPIIYPVALLKRAQKNQAAMEFLAFLQSGIARKAFEKAGFTVKR